MRPANSHKHNERGCLSWRPLRSSVLCPANAERYFAAVVGSSDLVFESIADDEFVGITTEIPAMKKKIRPASARANKPEAAIDYPAFQCTNRHEFLIRC
jgi:hypothetical protein